MGRQIRILLVEDEVILAMLMVRQLTKAGYAISRHVATGEEAVTSARENPPDIILMDIQLAGRIDGIEAAIAIKAGSDVPVIFITGYEIADFRERADIVRPLAYMIKPFDEAAFIKIMKDFKPGDHSAAEMGQAPGP